MTQKLIFSQNTAFTAIPAVMRYSSGVHRIFVGEKHSRPYPIGYIRDFKRECFAHLGVLTRFIGHICQPQKQKPGFHKNIALDSATS
jgi:hypothetical protein